MTETASSPILCYVDNALPGISRKKLARGWAYYGPEGKRITDRDEIDRLNAVALPPAYVDAWFCPSAQGHIQAIGHDERGRKQYRYHPLFRASQEADKYDRCADFGRSLPLLRARVGNDLARITTDRDTVVAAIVRLLDLGRVRVGNEAYARANKSFGATTLRRRHGLVRGSRLKLEFRAKSGKMQMLTIEDARLARLVRRCQDLPGQHLFQYRDDDGAIHSVGSSEVNDYIREATGGSFTAKHFRTWGASVIAYRALVEAGPEGLTLKQMIAPVAEALGNTPAIARKSYVHPALIEMASAKVGLPDARLPRPTKYLSGAERGLIALLEELASPPENCAEAA